MMKTLADTKLGETVEVCAVNDSYARIQALRFGINPGAVITAIAHIASGPIVVRSGRQEIAIGRPLAEKIQVRHGR